MNFLKNLKEGTTKMQGQPKPSKTLSKLQNSVCWALVGFAF